MPKLALNRLNRSCAYFPCHKPEGGDLASNSQSHDILEDCTFCYCPFYPCRDIYMGRYIIAKDGRKIWSCKDCSWIHKKKVVDKIFNLIRISNIKPQKLKVNPVTPKNIYSLRGCNGVKNTGIIILGHGSKLKKANDTIREVIQALKKKTGLSIIEPAYLQLFKPELHASVKKAVEKGCKRVIIVPFFLFMGNHVSRDIPKAIRQEVKIYKSIEFVYASNLGQDKRIVDIVLDCIRQVL